MAGTGPYNRAASLPDIGGMSEVAPYGRYVAQVAKRAFASVWRRDTLV
jgi:hypothetical protein